MVFFRYPKVIIGAQKKWQQDMTHSRHSHRMQGDVSALRALIEDGHEATMENHGKTEIIG